MPIYVDTFYLCPSLLEGRNLPRRQSLRMTHHPAKFARFFIFNPVKFGLREENDFEKLFFFYPPNLTLAEKMMEVGLCEALVQLPRCLYNSNLADLSLETAPASSFMPQHELCSKRV